MVTRFKLDKIIKVLENKFGTKAMYVHKLGGEYTFGNLTEDKLKEAGFEFYGYDMLHNYPMYRYENLEGYFDQQIFHLYEWTV